MQKSIIFSLFIIAIVLFGCKSQQKATSYNYDDVYSTKSPRTAVATQPKVQNEDLSATQQATIADTSATLKSSATNSGEDLSSNSYASRIKHFSNKNPGLNYSDSYYSGSADSTSSGGSSPDINLYFGNSWGSLYGGYPYSWYDPFMFGYPYSWYSPFYYGYYPYYSYWDYPYYGDSYWYGNHHHHSWDWNNWGGRNSYYGQRRSLTAPDGGQGTVKNTRVLPATGNQIGQGQNARTTASEVTRSTDVIKSGRNDQPRVTPDKQRYNYSRGKVTATGTTTTRTTVRTGNTRTTANINSQRQQTVPRYVRPAVQQPGARQSNAQTYTSPAYRQPKSSQEYINPRSQPGRPAAVNENNNTRTYNNPNPAGRRYSTPANNNGNSRIYSNPSNSGRSYSTPSRSYPSSGGQRSSGSGYSAPSRSSSSPSHSSGGSSGSGSGSGGGRRR